MTEAHGITADRWLSDVSARPDTVHVMAQTGFLGIDAGGLTWAGMLDGAVGAAIGGIATVGAAWLAFAADRRAQRRHAVDAAASKLKLAATELAETLALRKMGRSEDLNQPYRRVMLAASDLIDASRGREKHLENGVTLIATSLGDLQAEPDKMQITADTLVKYLNTWRDGPKEIRSGRINAHTALEQAIRDRGQSPG